MTQRQEEPAALAAAHAPTAQCLLRDGTITYANRAAGALFDASGDALEGKAFAALVAETDADSVERALDDVTEDTTVRFSPAAGRRGRTIESTWRAVEEAPDGTIVGTLTDVTDRVELEHESEMLESALDALPLSLYFKDAQSRHERVSWHTLCQGDNVITNADGKRHHVPEDLEGKTDFDIYEGDWVAGAVDQDRAVMAAREPVVDEVHESTTSLGESFFASTTKAPRYDADGNVIGIVGVTMDVTDRMTARRELERQNERFEEFTEVLTHDLRNPLTVADGYAGMLAERYDDPEFDKLDDALERMSTLITEIRSFVLEGRTVENPEPADLATLASEAWDCVETDDATLAVETTHTIRADDCRVTQLLENLYRNAVEHGGADVSITVGDLEDGFYLADDGPGIPDGEKDRVLERGFSTDDDSTGFGLAIVANIADAHDWSVSVVDGEEGGARFEFRDVVRVDGEQGH